MSKGEFLSREMARTRDAVYGTMAWIEGRVSADVYEKMKTFIEQSIRYGILKNILEGHAFRDGLEKELD